METALLVAGAVATVAAASAVLIGVVRFVVRMARNLGHLVDDVRGEPARPGVAERPGILVRLQQIETQIAAVEQRVSGVEHELTPNSGLSLRDAVDRVERAQADHLRAHTAST